MSSSAGFGGVEGEQSWTEQCGSDVIAATSSPSTANPRSSQAPCTSPTQETTPTFGFGSSFGAPFGSSFGFCANPSAGFGAVTSVVKEYGPDLRFTDDQYGKKKLTLLPEKPYYGRFGQDTPWVEEKPETPPYEPVYTPKPKSLVLQVEGKEILADKQKLAAISPYFNCLLFGEFKKADSDVVTIHDGDYRSLEACLKIYEGERPWQLKTRNGVEELMAAADYFDFALVRLACDLSLQVIERKNVKMEYRSDYDLPQFDEKTSATDMVLDCFGGEIHVEKKLLCSMSGLFRRLFDEELSQNEYNRFGCGFKRKYLVACMLIFCGHSPSMLDNVGYVHEILCVAGDLDFPAVRVICGIRLVQMSRMEFERCHFASRACITEETMEDIERIWRKNQTWHSEEKYRHINLTHCMENLLFEYSVN